MCTMRNIENENTKKKIYITLKRGFWYGVNDIFGFFLLLSLLHEKIPNYECQISALYIMKIKRHWSIPMRMKNTGLAVLLLFKKRELLSSYLFYNQSGLSCLLTELGNEHLMEICEEYKASSSHNTDKYIPLSV